LWGTKDSIEMPLLKIVYFSFALLDDVLNSEDFGDAEIYNLYDILFLGVKKDILQFEISMLDTFSVTMPK